MTTRTETTVLRLRAAILAVAAPLNAALALLTVFSAYGGMFDPVTFVVAALTAMALPVVLIAGAAVTALDLVFMRRLAWVIPAAWIVSAPSLLTFSPLNILPHSAPTPQQRAEGFTFMTYNTLQFQDFEQDYSDWEQNRTVDYILEKNPDVVNLQEVRGIATDRNIRLTHAQIERLKARYPYYFTGIAEDLTVLSKFPITQTPVEADDPTVKRRIGVFTLDVRGRKVTLINVHLESIGLTRNDKELYTGIITAPPSTKGELKRDVREVRSQLISKLSRAFDHRVTQARYVRSQIDSIGGCIIVAGDFNDIQGCYAQRVIMGNDMHDAYTENAFGPTITYRADMFYFRIDHILYSDGLDAIGIKRGNSRTSDHYPLMTEFVFTDQPTIHKTNQ